jgi:hypothetical protein
MKTLEHQPTHSEVADMSRRGFLCSLGALALSACGAGTGTGIETGQAAGIAPRQLAAGAGTGAFVHPGLLHTQADFDRMVQKYKTAPWSGSYSLMVANSHSSLTRTAAPETIVYRGYDGVHAENYAHLFNDIAAAYACALRWKITGNTAYADKAVYYMNVWSKALTAIAGTSDRYLAAGIYGYEFANVGEIMRGYTGLASADFVRFQDMMRNIFYAMNHDFLVNHNKSDITHYWANWDICNMASMLAIGVLCDDRAIFDEAVAYFKEGAGNGAIAQAVYHVHPGYLGQWQETGRDQGHNLLGIALMGPMCEMAWNQGVDLYGYDNNRFLMGAEYVAKANLRDAAGNFNTVPYVPYNNADKVNQAGPGSGSQGEIRPIWALVVHHYVSRKGLAAPYSQQFAQLVAPEGGGGNYGTTSTGYDQLGYGTLTYTRDPVAPAAAPSGLSAWTSGGAVVLSWWGCPQASGYNVKRSASAGGPYTLVASGIKDPLTWADPPPTAGTWYYVVTAALPSGESAASNEVAAVSGIQLHTRLPFDDAAGSTALDVSGNGHAGLLAGGATWSTGRRGGAVALDGGSGHVALPADLVRDVGDFTIAAWVWWNASRANERVFDFGAGTGRYMMLTARGATGNPRFAITVNGSYGEVGIDANAALPTGRWVHVAVTLSGNSATLYLDGVAAGANDNLFLAPFRLKGTTQNWLGRGQAAGTPYFNGRIDDFRLVRGALAAADLQALVSGLRDVGASVKLTQQGATLNRATQKYAGGVTITNTSAAALAGPLQLRLAALSAGVTLDNASGYDGAAPYVTLAGPLAAGSAATVALTFTNPGRTLVSYTPALFQVVP